MERVNSRFAGNPINNMNMKTNTIATLIGSSAIALLFTSCDSPQEQAREEQIEQKAESMEAQADQLREQGENVADAKEDRADAIREGGERAADATEDSADVTRDRVEERADQIEDAADDVRKQK